MDPQQELVLRVLRRSLHRQKYGPRRQWHNQDRLWDDFERRAEPGDPGNHVRGELYDRQECEVGSAEPDLPILVSATESVACDGYESDQREPFDGVLRSSVHAARVGSDDGQMTL